MMPDGGLALSSASLPHSLKRGMIETLVSLLKIDSRSTVADTNKIVKFLAHTGRKNGLAAVVTGPAGGPQSLLVHIKGTGNRTDGLILLSHLDTAGWEENAWQHHPLSAARTDDGRIYGRGAIDCKSLAAVWLHICIEYLRSGKQPKRDICFIATSDEESGGGRGTKWLMENSDVTSRCSVALNEGGGYICRSRDARKTFITCQHGEKGRIEFNTCSDQPGKEVIVRETGFWGCLSHLRSIRRFKSCQNLFRGFAVRPDLLHCFFSTATIAGGRLVLANHPEADVGRLIPGLKRTGMHPPDQRFSVKSEATLSPLKTPLYQCIRKAGADAGFSGVFPTITRGNSDSRFLRERGIATYGFFPLGLREKISTIHAHNEFIHQESLIESYLLLSNIVDTYCS